MTKYEIKRDTFEFRFGTYKDSIPAMSSKEIFDMYLSRTNYPEPLYSYDTEAEALACFDPMASTWAEKGNVFWLLRGEVRYIEINEYDEDGEFDRGGDILVYAAEAYEKED